MNGTRGRVGGLLRRMWHTPSLAVFRHDGWVGRRMSVWGLLLAAYALVASPAVAQHSAAREWNEEMLSAIRRDLARPTVHARNLFHVSVAMWDGWAVYDATADTFLIDEHAHADDVEAARAETISFAAYRVLRARFAASPGAATSLASFDAKMKGLGYDKNFTSTAGSSPAALGNRIAQAVLQFGLNDNSNEQNGYANQHYVPINPPLVPALPGNPDMIDPNRWQPLALQFFIDQGGNVIVGGYPPALTPEWGRVTPFSLSPADLTLLDRGDGYDWWVYHDPGPPPLLGGIGDAAYKWGFEQVVIWSSHLDPSDGVMWDISPGARGNSGSPDPDDYASYYNLTEGGDYSIGHSVNPVTGKPYAPHVVPRGDFARVLAEFWADGPASETPPGHWFTLLNYVSDNLLEKRIGGIGPILSDLEWDVKSYLALGGAMHDVAVAVWGVKGWCDYTRPISAIRYMADRGQSSDPNGLSYDPNGIHLYGGLIELVTPATTAPGQRHADLAGHEGKIAVKAWRGPQYIGNPQTTVAGVGWILAENWWPYQRPTFVTPPFPGFTSGHSAYSRGAAEVLTLLTGSPYFPGGLGEFHCAQNQYLVFEDGPSVDITLQWATYHDAAVQSAFSRIWGGIHPGQDDLPSRKIGEVVGIEAFHFAETYFDGTAGSCQTGADHLDTDVDGFADGCDQCAFTTPVGGCECVSCCRAGCLVADADGDGMHSLLDYAALQNCFSARNGYPGYVPPTAVCLTTFDLELDDDVDLEDFEFLYATLD